MVSKVRGQFTSYDATIVTSEDPLGSSAAETIDLASIDTGDKRRDNHLSSAEFLEVETYPTMSYRSTGIRQTDDGWIIDGELTLHGVTRQVPLAVEANGRTWPPAWPATAGWGLPCPGARTRPPPTCS